MNIARIENKLVIISDTAGAAAYDFDFSLHFQCSHPYAFSNGEPCVLRIDAILDYDAHFLEKQEWGLTLVNSPRQHRLASELQEWYPLIADLTPKTMVFDTLPTVAEVESAFNWPVFLKGSRQTSRHNPELSIIPNATHYLKVMERYSVDPILHWQKPAVREFVQLQPVPGNVPGKIASALEFRSFWWQGQCVGWGQYWYQVPAYAASDIDDGLAIAAEASRRLQVPFLVIDIAKTAKGNWIIIECNDAQESGYASIAPHLLWRRILDLGDFASGSAIK